MTSMQNFLQSSGENHFLRVIKVGGSLLTWPGLRDALPAWLKSLSPGTNLLLFGGGECVEAMRDLDAIWKLDPAAMHWRCVKLLDATCEIAQELWPQWPTLRDLNHIPSPETSNTLSPALPTKMASEPDRTLIVQVSTIYTRDTHTLPYNWATTTDSIAAQFAQDIKADELILLKSSTPTAPPASNIQNHSNHRITIDQAAQSGFVDAAFPSVFPRTIPIRSVQLTSPDWPETVLHSPPANCPGNNPD
jgi:aspartokinase-like uncharacterized kinase